MNDMLHEKHRLYIETGNLYTKVNLSDIEYFIILGTKVYETCKANIYVGENNIGEKKLMSLENYRLILEDESGLIYEEILSDDPYFPPHAIMPEEKWKSSIEPKNLYDHSYNNWILVTEKKKI